MPYNQSYCVGIVKICIKYTLVMFNGSLPITVIVFMPIISMYLNNCIRTLTYTNIFNINSWILKQQFYIFRVHLNYVGKYTDSGKIYIRTTNLLNVYHSDSWYYSSWSGYQSEITWLVVGNQKSVCLFFLTENVIIGIFLVILYVKPFERGFFSSNAQSIG